MQRLDPNSVTDRESFVRFVEALVEDRGTADQLEAEEPGCWRWGGANGWMNSSIASYLESALAAVSAQERWGSGAGTGPTWQELAHFLWLGKTHK